MDNITEAKKEFRLRQWTQIIQSCQDSGMKIVTWCEQNNVNVKSYYYWLRKIRSLACETKSLIPQRNDQPIVPVGFKPTNTTSAAVTIHMPTVSIDIHDGASSETIQSVLLALRNIC